MDAQARLDLLVAEHRDVFVEAAKLMQERGEKPWSMDIPCVVIDGRKKESTAVIHPVGTLGSVVSTSSAIDVPEVRQWLEIAAERGAEVAFAEMLNHPDEEVGARFAEGYDELRRERKEGRKGLWSASDLSRFVMKTREAFPESIGCVAVLPGEGGMSHGLLTFESSVRSLLS